MRWFISNKTARPYFSGHSFAKALAVLFCSVGTTGACHGGIMDIVALAMIIIGVDVLVGAFVYLTFT